MMQCIGIPQAHSFMKPPPFCYIAPDTVEEIVELLAQHGSDSRVLAGGQSLVPLMNLRMARPEVLIDLNRCSELAVMTPTGSGLTIGATVRQMQAQRSPHSAALCPLVSQALAHAGPVAVRNRATIGGTLAHADRAAELPGVAVALDAMFTLASASGTREVPASVFFQGDMSTAIEPHEFLRSVRFPKADETAFSDFLEVGLREEGIAIVGLAGYLAFADDETVREARLAVIGVEPAPVRLTEIESALQGRRLDQPLTVRAADMAHDAVAPEDDAMVTGIYRRRVTSALVKRLLEAASTGGCVEAR